MPIYEFHCSYCKRDSEVLVRTSDWKGTRCPHCGSTRLQKKLSVFASAEAGGGECGPCGDGAACGLNPGSCGCCGSGRPHRH